MADHHALRPAGRSGRVDHVGERLGRDRDVRVRRRPLGDAVPIDVEADLAFDRAAEVLARAPFGEQNLDVRVRCHVLQAFDGIVRIERDVRAAGFEDAEERNDHLERAAEADADAGLGDDAELAEVVGEPIRTGVQLAVGHPLVAAFHGDCRRVVRRLHLEQLDDRAARKFTRSLVPSRDVASFGCGEQRQLGNALLRIGRGGFEQCRVMQDQPLNRRAIEEVGAVLDRPGQRAAAFLQRHVEIEFRSRRVDRDEPVLESGQRDAGARRILQRKENLEDWRAAQVAFGLQLLDQLLERQILMRVAVEADLAHARQKVADARIARQIGAEDERVHEETDQAFDLGAVAIRHRRPDGDVGSSGVARQQHVPRGEQRHEERDALASAQSIQRFGQRRRQLERFGGAAL